MHRTEPEPAPHDEPLVIDCDSCAMQHTPTCDDCVVSYLCGPPAATAPAASTATVIAFDELVALRRMQRVGLVPGVRHRRASG